MPVALIDLISLPPTRYVIFFAVAFHAGSLTPEAGEAASSVTRPVPSERTTVRSPSETKAILPLRPGNVPAAAIVCPTAAVTTSAAVTKACALSFLMVSS